MQQNKHTACCTLYKNKRALSSSLFGGLFSVRSCCLFFFQAASWCGGVRMCVCECCVPRGRRLGTCNAWLCSPVRHGRRIASIAEAARRMGRRNSSIGAPGGDPAPLGAAAPAHGSTDGQEGRQQGAFEQGTDPQASAGDCDPLPYFTLKL